MVVYNITIIKPITLQDTNILLHTLFTKKKKNGNTMETQPHIHTHTYTVTRSTTLFIFIKLEKIWTKNYDDIITAAYHFDHKNIYLNTKTILFQ